MKPKHVKLNYCRKKKIRTVTISGGERRGNLQGRDPKKLSGVTVMSYVLTGTWVTQVYSLVKALVILHLRTMHFTVCKFYKKKQM